MPKIGLRIIKSAIAVQLTFVVYLIRGSGMPFYSAIAAVLCIQQEMGDSVKKAKNRTIATFIGGVFGMFVLVLLQSHMVVDNEPLRYSIISVMIIPLIYVTVLLKQPDSTYLSCVCFLSINISHIGDANPYAFAMARMLDTLIGIAIALGVNAIRMPHRFHREILLEVPLANLYIDASLQTHTKLHINRVLDAGANLLLTSHKTPSEVLTFGKELHPHIQYLLMDGVLRFDMRQNHAMALKEMSVELWQNIYHECYKQAVSIFLYEVKDGMLYTHYDAHINATMKQEYELHAKHTGCHYVSHEQAISKELHQPIVAFAIIDAKQRIEDVQKLLRAFFDEITWILYPVQEDEDVRLLRIYPQSVAGLDLGDEIRKELQLTTLYKVRSNGITCMKEIEKVVHKGVRN